MRRNYVCRYTTKNGSEQFLSNKIIFLIIYDINNSFRNVAIFRNLKYEKSKMPTMSYYALENL